MSDWKKTSDEMPPPFAHVLTCIKHEHDGKVYRSYCVDWTVEGGSWAIQHKFLDKPTHWTQLPEGP